MGFQSGPRLLRELSGPGQVRPARGPWRPAPALQYEGAEPSCQAHCDESVLSLLAVLYLQVSLTLFYLLTFLLSL